MNKTFNQEFCEFLEYHLEPTFRSSGNQTLRGFWCDGISWFPYNEIQLTQKNVNDNRKIETVAWLGTSGQIKHEMTIHLGKYALRRYARGTSMIDCIPSSDSMDWIDIDIKSETIEIWLK